MSRVHKLLDDDLIRAAEILEREAQALIDSMTMHGRWILIDEGDRRAKAECLEMQRIAKRFRNVVGYL